MLSGRYIGSLGTGRQRPQCAEEKVKERLGLLDNQDLARPSHGWKESMTYAQVEHTGGVSRGQQQTPSLGQQTHASKVSAACKFRTRQPEGQLVSIPTQTTHADTSVAAAPYHLPTYPLCNTHCGHTLPMHLSGPKSLILPTTPYTRYHSTPTLQMRKLKPREGK